MTEVISPLPPATEVEVEDFAFRYSSPHSLRDSFSSPPVRPLSALSREPGEPYDYDAANDIIDDALADNELLSEEEQQERRISGHSSISSFPGSVIQRPLEEPKTPTRYSAHLQGLRNDSGGSFADRNVSPRLGRGFGSAFRNPSSVKAMQMRDDDLESVVVPQHKRSGSRMSHRSHKSVNSIHSSPSKRQSRSSPLKKEFPLVLLHCTLLAPAASTMPVNCDNELYAALLPEEYQKRWNSLQDRLADPEMKARGVLIPHPQEDYELLEERLLDTLELENPRIRANHFFHSNKSGGDSGFESGSQTDEESSDDATKDARCPDCGKCLHLKLDGERKWEIKVYAANGLMRAGAWGAAWREMEKVDIEISLAMPEDVRREVNARLDALRIAQEDTELPDDPSSPVLDAREQEIYGSRPASSAETRGAYTEVLSEKQEQFTSMPQPVIYRAHHADFLRDRKNIIIVLLSVLVLFYALTGTAKHSISVPEKAIVTSASVTQAQTSVITTTSVLTSTMTVENVEYSASGIPSPIAAVVQATDEIVPLDSKVKDEPSPAKEPTPEGFDDQELVRDHQEHVPDHQEEIPDGQETPATEEVLQEG